MLNEPIGPRISSLLAEAVWREPLIAVDAKSGSALERLRMADGRMFVLKRMVPAQDWLMRATGDTGRLLSLWQSGVLARVPPSIEHGIVAVERDGEGVLVLMRDLSSALLPDDLVLTRDQGRRVLRAMAALYDQFWEESLEGLCSVRDLYLMLSPATAEREREGSHEVPHLIRRGWEAFADIVPEDVANAVFTVLADPAPLADELARHETTLIHGDLKLGNIGLLGHAVVLLDWDRMGVAPPAVDFAWYLAINASRIAATREQLIDDFRVALGDRHDEGCLQLALLGGLVQLGWNKALDATQNPDATVRERERSDLDWWIATARAGIEAWSPA